MPRVYSVGLAFAHLVVLSAAASDDVTSSVPGAAARCARNDGYRFDAVRMDRIPSCLARDDRASL